MVEFGDVRIAWEYSDFILVVMKSNYNKLAVIQLKGLSWTGLSGASLARCDKGYQLRCAKNYSSYINAEDYKEVCSRMCKVV